MEPGKAVARKEGIHGNPASSHHLRHRHPASLSGILTTNTPLGRRKYQEGGAHRKEFSKATGGKLNMTLQVTARKQTAFMNHEVPLLNVWGHPKPHN